jgi:histidine decarboxylase
MTFRYPDMPGLDDQLFEIPPSGLTREHRERAASQLRTFLSRQTEHFLGYQGNQHLTDLSALAFLLGMNTNNVGDPFTNGNCTVNTKVMERAALDYMARLWHGRVPSDPDDPESYWGYVVSMGSTEGNLYGLYNARDYLSGKRLWREPSGSLAYIRPLPHATNQNAYRPIAFFGEDTHYSIVKVVRALAVRTFYEIGEKEYPGECPITGGKWPREVPSTGGHAGPGTIDIDALATLVDFFAGKGFPPLVVLNYGSTFKGAYDDVGSVGRRLMPILARHGLDSRAVAWDPDDPSKLDERTGYWIHVDAALGGTYMPFLEIAHRQGHIPDRGPEFDFRLPFVHSIVTSTHKWPGSPLPGGVYMTKRKFTLAPPDNPEYIGSPDSTFAGSRNALSPAFLWWYYASTTEEQEVGKIVEAQACAAYLEQRLRALERTLDAPLWIARSPLSLTVLFRRPSDAIVFKYSLSTERVSVDDEMRNYVHVYAMPSVTREKLDMLLEDLAQPDAFDFAPLERTAEVRVGERRRVRRLIHVPHWGRGFK